MTCPVHTQRRHPRICRFCRADEGEGALRLADTEYKPITREVLMAPPPPAPVEIIPVASPPKPSHQRHQRCRLSAYGLRHLHGAKQKSGVIVGESMNGTWLADQIRRAQVRDQPPHSSGCQAGGTRAASPVRSDELG